MINRTVGARRALYSAVFAAILAITPQAAMADDPVDANLKGETSLEEGAGRIEARLLTGFAVKQAAVRIIDDIGSDYSSLTFVVLPLPREGA